MVFAPVSDQELVSRDVSLWRKGIFTNIGMAVYILATAKGGGAKRAVVGSHTCHWNGDELPDEQLLINL